MLCSRNSERVTKLPVGSCITVRCTCTLLGKDGIWYGLSMTCSEGFAQHEADGESGAEAARDRKEWSGEKKRERTKAECAGAVGCDRNADGEREEVCVAHEVERAHMGHAGQEVRDREHDEEVRNGARRAAHLLLLLFGVALWRVLVLCFALPPVAAGGY